MKSDTCITVNLDSKPLLRSLNVTRKEIAVAQAEAENLLEILKEIKAISQELPPLIPKRRK